ncbi:MAG TPA: MFS transporter [Gemmataceae bacterium]|jgi:MFS family permease
MNPRRLFTASCIALITSAFSFMIRQNITDDLVRDFGLYKQQVGEIMGAAFLGMAIAMVVFAPLCDFLGMGRVLAFAWLSHLIGTLGTIFAGDLSHLDFVKNLAGGDVKVASYWVLFASTFLVGSGNGLVEIAINPLAATLFPREKTHYLNILHAWWPGGLIMSGLLATYAVTPETFANVDLRGFKLWQIKMALLLVPLAIYGLMSVGQTFPQTERVQHNVSTGEMFLQALRPMFLLWAFCMLLTASTELAPNQWQESVLTRTAHVSGTLVFVYTSALMFVMRFFAGPLAHKLSPVGMLTCSAILAAVGLYWLSYVDNAVLAFVAATVFGIGVAYFWPTMLGVTAERFPKGGALLLGLMGSIGNLAISQALPQMGAIYDSYTVQAIPGELQNTKVPVPEGEPVPLVVEEKPSWLPQAITQHIYPAGSRKLNPDAVNAINERAKNDGKEAEEKKKTIENAERNGAAWAFRWVAVLPCILVVVFGLIALTDRLRGGYKAVHITDGQPSGNGALGHAPAPSRPDAVKGAGGIQT